jgi:hypothetical protein
MGRRRAKGQPTSQTPASGVANRQVLGNYELLYHICTFMDMPTLLHAQLVSKHWHDIISTSPLLQQNLYLKPRPSANIEQHRIVNPLLLKHFEPILRPRKSYYYLDRVLTHSTLAVPGMSIANMKDGRRVHQAFIRRGASWRKMLVAQPPITSIGYVNRINRDADWRLLSFPEGLRMGDLYDMVFQAVWSKVDEAERSACVDLPLHECQDYLLKRMSDTCGEAPVLLFTSESRLFADQGCSQGRCICSSSSRRRDKGCYWQKMEKHNIRGCKSTRWMFECEEFEERDYLSLSQPRFTTR